MTSRTVHCTGYVTDALNGAEDRRTRPYTLTHNGHVERYNRILAEEFMYARTWSSETERSGALTTWSRYDNYHHRPHGAPGGEPTASATPLRVDNVLASST